MLTIGLWDTTTVDNLPPIIQCGVPTVPGSAWGHDLHPAIEAVFATNAVMESARLVSPVALAPHLTASAITPVATTASRRSRLRTVPSSGSTIKFTNAADAHLAPQKVKVSGSISCSHWITDTVLMLARACFEADAWGERRVRGVARLLLVHLDAEPNNVVPTVTLAAGYRLDTDLMARTLPGTGHPPTFTCPPIWVPLDDPPPSLDAQAAPPSPADNTRMATCMCGSTSFFLPGRNSAFEARGIATRLLRAAEKVGALCKVSPDQQKPTPSSAGNPRWKRSAQCPPLIPVVVSTNET
jgi:hypothetical protein